MAATTGFAFVPDLEVTPKAAEKRETDEIGDLIGDAASHYERGNFKAAVERLADAVNMIAAREDIHGYASY